MGFAGHSGKRIAGNAGNLKKLLMGFICIEVMQKVYDTLRHEGELITCPGPCMKKGWVSPALQASQVVVESGGEFETVRGFTSWVYAYLSLVAIEEDSLVEDNMGEKVDTKTFRYYPRVPTIERAANPPQDVRRDRGGLQWGHAQLGRPEGQVLHRGRGAEGGPGEGQVGEGRTSQDA